MSSRVLLTGGAGFIGSNLIRTLNAWGHHDIIVVDDLSKIEKLENLYGTNVSSVIDYRKFYESSEFESLCKNSDTIIHLGAHSSTADPVDPVSYLSNNTTTSLKLMEVASDNQIPFIYASSAATYGTTHSDEKGHQPLNVYGFSKATIDVAAKEELKKRPNARIVGLRFFNVYGPLESHKQKYASMIHQSIQKLQTKEPVQLFRMYPPAKRDFVYVGDVVDVIIHVFRGFGESGIFNVGTGDARSFEEMVHIVNDHLHKIDEPIKYVAFPEDLEGKYQRYTKADLVRLRTKAKFKHDFSSLEEGIKATIGAIKK